MRRRRSSAIGLGKPETRGRACRGAAVGRAAALNPELKRRSPVHVSSSSHTRLDRRASCIPSKANGWLIAATPGRKDVRHDGSDSGGWRRRASNCTVALVLALARGLAAVTAQADWSPAASILHGRVEHTATLLASGSAQDRGRSAPKSRRRRRLATTITYAVRHALRRKVFTRLAVEHAAPGPSVRIAWRGRSRPVRTATRKATALQRKLDLLPNMGRARLRAGAALRSG